MSYSDQTWIRMLYMLTWGSCGALLLRLWWICASRRGLNCCVEGSREEGQKSPGLDRRLNKYKNIRPPGNSLTRINATAFKKLVCMLCIAKNFLIYEKSYQNHSLTSRLKSFYLRARPNRYPPDPAPSETEKRKTCIFQPSFNVAINKTLLLETCSKLTGYWSGQTQYYLPKCN